jgi:uncharacterized protein
MGLFGGTFQADISPDVVAGTPLIRAYGDDYFHLGNERYHDAIMLHQGAIIAPWQASSVAELSLAEIQAVMDQPPEIFLLGTGRSIAFPPQAIVDALSAAGIGFEFMDSRAAARTYNIIVSEGRTISACLFLPQHRD